MLTFAGVATVIAIALSVFLVSAKRAPEGVGRTHDQIVSECLHALPPGLTDHDRTKAALACVERRERQ